MKEKAVIVVGSNYQDSKNNVERGVKYIGERFKIIRQSQIYASPDFLGTGHQYHNAVLEILSDLPLKELGEEFKNYERQAGRTPGLKSQGKIPIDIDIVVYADRIVRPKDFNTKYFRIGWESVKG